MKEANDLLKNKIIDGYAYIIGSGSMKAWTGSGGAKNFIDECRKAGMTDFLIEQSIEVDGNTLDKLTVVKKQIL